MDGYPDLMFQILTSTGVSTAQLWQNVPCDDTMCSENAISMGRRYFQNYNTPGTQALTGMTDVFATSFLDIGEDGTLDMVVMQDSLLEKTKSKKTIAAVQNSIDWDGYFFKVLGSFVLSSSYDHFFLFNLNINLKIGLNGLCTQWCDTEPKFPDPKVIRYFFIF